MQNIGSIGANDKLFNRYILEGRSEYRIFSLTLILFFINCILRFVACVACECELALSLESHPRERIPARSCNLFKKRQALSLADALPVYRKSRGALLIVIINRAASYTSP